MHHIACPADALQNAPYLAPVPFRGRPCEPAFVIHTARRLAAERGMDVEAFAALTTANALSLFQVRTA